MTDRYYSETYDELYYIFDSHTVTKKELDEKIEYGGYTAFEDSLSDNEILDLLNQLAEMKEVGLKNVNCLNCDFFDYSKEDNKNESACKKNNNYEMNLVLICNEWRKKK